MSGERCLFCDAPATRLCDNVIALVESGWHKPAKGPPYKITSMEAMLATDYTCSAPFCAEHGRVVGHICGKDGDTIDNCIGCFEKWRSGRNGIMPPDEIAARRRQWHAEYRRRRIASIA